MPITALPEATVRLLGSTQALTTPTSLVKELIDNALDAKATHIDILISPNTIDKIEVRDNGHGIQLEDLDALGRRGHTSKLRTFDDLKAIGGISLGFRGEALFSAVQLGHVSVTTKTEGEAVATSVKLKSLGGVESQTRISHPIGTTISITNFLSKLPVRHQTALKEAPKTLGKVKELLQSYALARPHIRFNLKVVKGAKGSWSFSPRSNDGIKEAVSQIIGRDAATQCVQKSLSFSEVEDWRDTNTTSDGVGSGMDFETQNNKFIFDMFLPRPNGDVSKFSHGQYISIDGRPVSHEKGTMKRIITIFKRYIRDSFSNTPEKVRNPFLRLGISCPVGSYDPNIEPAKDDVLFCNEDLVLENIEQAFKEVYGEPKLPDTPTTTQKFSSKMDNFELLLARKAPLSNPDRALKMSSSDIHQEKYSSNSRIAPNIHSDEQIPLSNSSRKQDLGVDMSLDYNDEVELGQRINKQTQNQMSKESPDIGEEHEPSHLLNPWIIAKLITPVREQSHESSPDISNLTVKTNQRTNEALLTPQQSSDPAGDPDLLSASTSIRQAQVFRSNDANSPVDTRAETLIQEELPQSSVLPPSRCSLTTSSDEELFVPEHNRSITERRNDFISARNITDSQPETISFNFSRHKKGKWNDKPFVSPLQTTKHHATRDGLRQTKLAVDSRAERTDLALNKEHDHADLAWAMDFENRKEEATRRRREQLRVARLEAEVSGNFEESGGAVSPPPRLAKPSPHKNRYNAAVATINAGYPPSKPSKPTPEVSKTTLPDVDPRGYLMRRQKSLLNPGAPKMTRAKSMRLPLERIPDGEQMHSLLLRVPMNMDHVKRVCNEVRKDDLYISRGTQSRGLVISATEKENVVESVRNTVDRWKETNENEKCEVEYCFDNLQCST